MIIKEYRIPLPMTVEEYRIAQLYMIQVGLGARAGHAGRTDGSRTLGWGGAAPWSPQQCLLSRLLVSVSVAQALWLPSPMPGTQGVPWVFVALACPASPVFTALAVLTLFALNTRPLSDSDVIRAYSQLGPL